LTLCDDDFWEFVHPLMLRLRQKNERVRQQYGDYSQWDWDPDAATLTFRERGQPDLCVDVTLVGTTEGGSWEWSWANPNISPDLKRDMEQIPAFGEAHGYQRLSLPFLKSGQETGLEMTAVTAHVLNAPGSFFFSTGDGYCYLVYRKIRVAREDDRPVAASRREEKITISNNGWDEMPEPQAAL
jgi:hypothetical protein